MANNKRFFKTVKKGDRPSAGEHNKITRALSELTGAANQTPRSDSKIRLIKLDSVVGRFNPLNESSEAREDRDTPATFRHYNVSTEEFEDSDREIGTVCDPFELVYDAEEYVFAFYSKQCNKFLPINPRTVRHAITVRDRNGDYPASGNTYPIKFVKLSYNEIPGYNPVAPEYLHGSEAWEDDYVLNIVDPEIADSYLPRGTVIQVYNVTRQWFTSTCCAAETSSSSSSSSSNSSSSQSISESSSSDSASLSSLSSASSLSSISVSESSLSSSSGGSSLSLSGSSGYTCVPFVSCWTFNEETCEATVTYGQLCIPSELGILVTNDIEAPAC